MSPPHARVHTQKRTHLHTANERANGQAGGWVDGTHMRVPSHIDWRTLVRTYVRTCIPLEAGSRNTAATTPLRGNRIRRNEGLPAGVAIAPGEAPVVDEGQEASLGDNDIVPGHLSCARVQRVTHYVVDDDAWRADGRLPGSHRVAPAKRLTYTTLPSIPRGDVLRRRRGISIAIPRLARVNPLARVKTVTSGESTRFSRRGRETSRTLAGEEREEE